MKPPCPSTHFSIGALSKPYQLDCVLSVVGYRRKVRGRRKIQNPNCKLEMKLCVSYLKCHKTCSLVCVCIFYFLFLFFIFYFLFFQFRLLVSSCSTNPKIDRTNTIAIRDVVLRLFRLLINQPTACKFVNQLHTSLSIATSFSNTQLFFGI